MAVGLILFALQLRLIVIPSLDVLLRRNSCARYHIVVEQTMLELRRQAAQIMVSMGGFCEVMKKLGGEHFSTTLPRSFLKFAHLRA